MPAFFMFVFKKCKQLTLINKEKRLVPAKLGRGVF
jgi:hypothetical protein